MGNPAVNIKRNRRIFLYILCVQTQSGRYMHSSQKRSKRNIRTSVLSEISSDRQNISHLNNSLLLNQANASCSAMVILNVLLFKLPYKYSGLYEPGPGSELIFCLKSNLFSLEPIPEPALGFVKDCGL